MSMSPSRVPRRSVPVVAALALMVGLAACSSGSAGSGGGGGGTFTAGGILFASGGPFNSEGNPMYGAYTIDGDFLQGTAENGSATGVYTPPSPGCSVSSNTSGGAPSIPPGATNVMAVSAGTLTTTDGTAALATIPYSSDGIYDYDTNSHPTLQWNPGDVLTVSASGAAVPAFSGSITAPQYVSGLNPAITLASSITASAGTPFVVSWTPSTDNGTMQLLLTGNAMPMVTVACYADESSGSISVPVSLLQKLGSGGIVSLEKTIYRTITTSGIDVLLQAQTPLLSGTLTLM
jgi:hypothetical protein